ncbi:HD domain-containing protein [Chromobacterium rhizoryzae]|uniref:HD domain-containing protein n=1 Tax=Chromobacterium rhizoryzae TaxID=1778675 RepID=UPI001D082706|nr:HD domain-containing protein [Chromobacterium rhizoryzae]
MTSNAALSQSIQFFLELDKLKEVIRKNWIASQQRRENSAEHSWQVAMLAMALQPHANEPVALDRVVRLLLVHDVGEIVAGDVSVFDRGEGPEEKEAERAGAAQVFNLLPQAQAEEMLALWDEFEQGFTAEARFANAIDRLAPALLNLHSDGKGWKEQQVRKSQVLERVMPGVRQGCRAAAGWLEQALEQAEQRGVFPPER